MVALAQGILASQVALLLAGFAFAAYSDLRRREVTDLLWQLLGLAGVALGAVALLPLGGVALGVWLVVGALAIEHMFAWDVALGPRAERYADLIELVFYVAVVALVFELAFRGGIGPSGVPWTVIATLATILFARALFEAGVLYGGADAKALMIAGVLLPLFPHPWAGSPPGAAALTAFLPFSVSLLMNAALFSVAVPIGIALRNLTRGEFELWRGFTGYSMSVRELPFRFVWVRDPWSPEARDEETEIETSEDDRKRRVALARALTERGVRRVWVTPQLPFLVLMALGGLAALVAGNVVVDLIALV